MTEPIKLSGKIVHGKGIGRTVEMPTANLCLEEGTLPKEGVYATYIIIEGRKFCAVTNIGKRPSVDQTDEVTIESHILDFEQDIYGEKVSLEIVKYLRPIRKFSGLDEVHTQVKKDIEEAKKYLDIKKTK